MLYKFVKKIKEMKELKEGWDGYEGKPIKVLDKLTEETVQKITKHFVDAGFNITDIHLIPKSNGGVQFEAEYGLGDGITYYYEIDVDEVK